jgi:hypothetical protein
MNDHSKAPIDETKNPLDSLGITDYWGYTDILTASSADVYL